MSKSKQLPIALSAPMSFVSSSASTQADSEASSLNNVCQEQRDASFGAWAGSSFGEKMLAKMGFKVCNSF